MGGEGMNIVKVKFTRVLAAAILVCGASVCSVGAFAQANYEVVTTKSGCAVAVEESLLKSLRTAGTLTWDWSGQCVNGMAAGFGERKQVLSSKNAAAGFTMEITQTDVGHMHEGLFYGFIKSRSQTRSSLAEIKATDQSQYRFCHRNRCVAMAGLGLKGADILLDVKADALPERGFEWERDTMFINDGLSGSLMLMKVPCSLDKARFPECGFGADDQKYEVFRFSQIPVGGGAHTHTYCPTPRDRSSCAGLAEKLSKPFVDSIEEFLIDSLPKLTKIDGINRNAGNLLTHRRKTELASEAVVADGSKTAGTRKAQTQMMDDPKTVGRGAVHPEELQRQAEERRLADERRAENQRRIEENQARQAREKEEREVRELQELTNALQQLSNSLGNMRRK